MNLAMFDLTFDSFDVRIVDQNGDPWFVLADICKVIGRSNPTRAAMVLDQDERSNLKLDRGGELLIVSEPGLNKIILRSNDAIKPGTRAHRFCRWVTHEVLPSIRKWGCYPPPEILLENPAAEAADDVSTTQQRFIAECRRIADERGVTVEQLMEPILSKPQLRAIELGHGPMIDLLHRGQRWVALMGIGMDLPYILHGIWDQTPAERQRKRQLRAAAAQRLQLPGMALPFG